MSAARSAFLAALAGLVTPHVALGQWVSFADETASRVTLNPFADDPLGDPMVDGQEKDVAVADLNRDGWDDLVLVRKRPFSNPGARQDALLMNEGGVLVDRTATLAPGFLTDLTDARDVVIEEFTGDDWPDVVIANTFWEQPKFYRNLGEDAKGNWLGLVNESLTRFPIISVANLGGPQFCAVVAGDVTGNGAPDLFFSNYAMCCAGTTDVLLINDGSGFFTDETATRLGSFANVAFGTAAGIDDLDNDSDNEIVKISTLYSAAPFDIGVFILYNDGAGVFNTLPFQEAPNNSPYFIDLGDLNGDGKLDIFVEQDPQDRLDLATTIVTDGPITYNSITISTSPRTAGFGGNTKLADVDRDGDLDVGVAPIDVDIQNCGSSNDFALLQNPGNGVVFDPWSAAADQNFHLDPHDFGFIDIDNDGCLDLFMGLCTGWRVFIQQNCCPNDVNGDGTTNVLDLVELLLCFGQPGAGGCTPADVNSDGTVNVLDLIELLLSFGLPCP